jgi:hypothetical protein
VRQQLRDPIESVLDEAGELVDAQAEKLNVLRRRLAREDLSVLEGVVASVAGDVEAFSARLSAVDGDQVLDAAQAIARRRGPWAFAAGGAALGLIVWRSLRSGARADVEGELASDELGDTSSTAGAQRS